MKTSPKFGIVFVVLTMATSVATAAIEWDGGGGDSDWHNALKGSGDALPTTKEVELDSGAVVALNGTDATLGNRLNVCRNGGDGNAADIAATSTVPDKLTMAKDDSGNAFLLDNANGSMTVKGRTEEPAKSGNIIIDVASGRDIEFLDAGQILDSDISDAGDFKCTNRKPADTAEGKVNLSVDAAGAYAEVSDDLFMGSGLLSVTNGGELVLDVLHLGNGGDGYMTAADAGFDSQLIDDRRVDIDEDITFGTTDGNQWFDILGNGELVIAGADDQVDRDAYNAMLTGNLSITSQEGYRVVSDYGETHGR
ncbi:MAG: hypothetical protein DRP65_07340 [Planctomycetota bacterium]|nr:MAG: hypothetical protein DRP65_07340 [Planctomycetota bacterium]